MEIMTASEVFENLRLHIKENVHLKDKKDDYLVEMNWNEENYYLILKQLYEGGDEYVDNIYNYSIFKKEDKELKLIEDEKELNKLILALSFNVSNLQNMLKQQVKYIKNYYLDNTFNETIKNANKRCYFSEQEIRNMLSDMIYHSTMIGRIEETCDAYQNNTFMEFLKDYSEFKF